MAIDYITLNDLVEEAVAIILADTAGGGTNDWCQTNYSADLKIYNGLDKSLQPSEHDAPYIVIYREGQQLGEAMGMWHYRLGFEVGISDNETTVTGRVTKQVGEQQVEILTHMIYDLLRNEMPCNANVDEMLMEVDSGTYPLFTAMMIITFNIPKPIGSALGL